MTEGQVEAPAAAPSLEGSVASQPPDCRAQGHATWARTLVAAAVVLAVGASVGALSFFVERALWLHPPVTTRSADGWRVESRHGRRFSGLALCGERLIWQNGPSIELLDLAAGKLRLLGPGPGMRATWAPAIGERYAVWFEAVSGKASTADVIAYDSVVGRRWKVAEIGEVYSLPSLSGTTAVWCSANGSATAVSGVDIVTGERLAIADGYGSPHISQELVVWSAHDAWPLTARDLTSNRTWSVVPAAAGGRFAQIVLAQRVLAWGQPAVGGSATSVMKAGVGGGTTQVVAAAVAGLEGPAFDGTTVAWAQDGPAGAGGVVMARRGESPAFVVATRSTPILEVVVSGSTVAWLTQQGDVSVIETGELPR